MQAVVAYLMLVIVAIAFTTAVYAMFSERLERGEPVEAVAAGGVQFKVDGPTSYYVVPLQLSYDPDAPPLYACMIKYVYAAAGSVVTGTARLQYLAGEARATLPDGQLVVKGAERPLNKPQGDVDSLIVHFYFEGDVRLLSFSLGFCRLDGGPGLWWSDIPVFR